MFCFQCTLVHLRHLTVNPCFDSIVFVFYNFTTWSKAVFTQLKAIKISQIDCVSIDMTVQFMVNKFIFRTVCRIKGIGWVGWGSELSPDEIGVHDKYSCSDSFLSLILSPAVSSRFIEDKLPNFESTIDKLNLKKAAVYLKASVILMVNEHYRLACLSMRATRPMKGPRNHAL